jgi:hypothetical protein
MGNITIAYGYAPAMALFVWNALTVAGAMH